MASKNLTVKTTAPGPRCTFRTIHQVILTPLFWGEKNGIGNEIRCMGVLVPLKFVSSFKSPDPLVFVTWILVIVTQAYTYVQLHKFAYINYVQFSYAN